MQLIVDEQTSNSENVYERLACMGLSEMKIGTRGKGLTKEKRLQEFIRDSSTSTHYMSSLGDSIKSAVEEIQSTEPASSDLAAISTPPLFISSQESSMHINSSNSEASAENQQGQGIEKNIFQQLLNRVESLQGPTSNRTISLLVSPSRKSVISIRPNSNAIQ